MFLSNQYHYQNLVNDYTNMLDKDNCNDEISFIQNILVNHLENCLVNPTDSILYIENMSCLDFFNDTNPQVILKYLFKFQNFYLYNSNDIFYSVIKRFLSLNINHIEDFKIDKKLNIYGVPIHVKKKIEQIANYSDYLVLYQNSPPNINKAIKLSFHIP